MKNKPVKKISIEKAKSPLPKGGRGVVPINTSMPIKNSDNYYC
jgi:hypothetical protein